MKTLILNSTTITLQLWDTAGQERYRSITEQYYRKADSILAMYDVTQSASFSAVRGWMDSVRVRGISYCSEGWWPGEETVCHLGSGDTIAPKPEGDKREKSV
uniref:Si:ch211-247i17.1 n=1 Tax=Xiphophorus couchianus TaxID=32473 RepID=A0A3B5L200_9TELE